MNTHPYLRAYLAGIFVPTLVLPLLLTVFIVVRIVLKVPFHRASHDLSHGRSTSLFGCGICSGLVAREHAFTHWSAWSCVAAVMRRRARW